MPYDADEWDRLYYALCEYDRAAICTEARNRLRKNYLQTKIIPQIITYTLVCYTLAAILLFAGALATEHPLTIIVGVEALASAWVYGALAEAIVRKLSKPIPAIV